MPQMAPYNWLLLNLIFSLMLLLYMIILNFLPIKKSFYPQNKKKFLFLIKW